MKVTGKVLIMTLVLVATMAANGWAGDNIQVSVQDLTPAASIKLNGNDAIQGTLQLWYTVNAYSFPTGSFGTFRIDMKDVHLSGLTNSVYPAQMTLKQNGGDFLVLTPAKTTFDVSGQGWQESTVVTMSISSGASNADGAELVGNLNFSINGKNKVGTPSSVQVHILLVHPTNCIKVYNFMADAGATTVYGDAFLLDVKLKDGEVNSASPGTVSYNVVASNICSQNMTVDLGAQLDPAWDVVGAQAVKLYSAAGDIDLAGWDITLFSNSQNNGTSLCFQNATVSAGKTVLLNIKTTMEDGVLATALGSSFTFSGSLRQAGTSCTGNLEPLASPNPVSTDLGFITTIIGSGSSLPKK